MTAEVEIEYRNGVAIVTLNAVQRKNAITPAMARELVDAFDQVDADPDVGAVVVFGAGGSFCAGAHRDVISGVGPDPVGRDAYESIGIIYESFARLGRVRVPTIAAVTGAAVGAGMNLALGADLRIVARNARFKSGFVGLGIHPGGGFFTLANRLVGAEATAAIGIFGEEVSGVQAQALGMAWDAVDDGDVLDRAVALAERVGSQPELARDVVATLRMEVWPPGMSWPVALQAERAPQLRSLRRRHTEPPAP